MNDHELKVGSTTKRLNLLRNPEGGAYYQVSFENIEHQAQLKFIQEDWGGGHGQYDFKSLDKYFSGEGIDTTQPGCVFLGPLVYEVKENDDTDLDSAVVCFCWHPATSEWLCATAGKIYRYNVGSSGKWHAATTTVAGVTHLCVHNAIVYAACGASTKMYYSADGDTWTQTDLTDGYAVRLLSSPNSAGTANVLWKFKTPNELSSTTDGRTVAGGGSQWTSATYVGDESTDITNIFLVNDRLCVGKTNNLFHYDSDGGIHALLADLRQARTTRNFSHVTDWQAGT